MKENLTIVRPNGSEFSVDMTELRRLEARQAAATSVGRMEILAVMADMKDGYQQAGELRATIGLELDRAKTATNTRSAVVRLDLVQDVLKQKNLWTARNPGGSAEQREDVLATDKEYLALQDYVSQLAAARELLHVKMEAFRMTYSTVKRNFDDQLTGMLPKNYNGGPQVEPRPARDYLPRSDTAVNTLPLSMPPQEASVAAGQIQETNEDFGILIGKARY